MRNLKKFLTVFLLILPFMLIASCQLPGGNTGHTHKFVNGECSCGEKDPNYGKQPLTDMITIKSLQAQVNNEPVQEEKSKVRKMSMRMKSHILFEDEDVIEGDLLEVNTQYIVMYKSETDIKFTITLNNPKGMSIDAVELTCDDPNSQIMMDGVYEDIQMSAEKSVIVNWSQENPYKKTYNIRTTSDDFINTLRVIDIKVNGEWQGESLEKDELKIYKIANDDLKWNFITNTPEFYKWRFTFNEELIQNLVVKADGEVLEADEEGIYTVEKNCHVTWEYEVVIEGIAVKWNGEKEIELFWIEYPEDESIISYHMIVAEANKESVIFYIGVMNFRGTDILYDEDMYKLIINQELEINYFEFKFEQESWISWNPAGIYAYYSDADGNLTDTKINYAEIYINGYYGGRFILNWEWQNSIKK